MKRIVLAATLAIACAAAFAQPYGPGPGPRGGPRFGADMTPGWSMMTPEERKAHQDKMGAMKDPAECQAYIAEHHKQMEARAREKGKALPFKGPGPGCDWLKPKA